MIPDSFHALTSHLRRPAFLLSVEGRILALNPSARALVDRSTEAQGTFLGDHVVDDPAHVSDALRRWSSSGGFAGRDLSFRNGGSRPLRCRAEGMRIAQADDGGTPLILMRCADILSDATPVSGTPTRVSSFGEPDGRPPPSSGARPQTQHPPESAETPSTMEIVGNIAGGIAQEFNNLMTVVQAEAEWALQKDSDPAVRESLTAIHRASEQASKLVSSLLSFSRRQFVQTEEFDLRELVEEALPAEFRLFDDASAVVINQAAGPLMVLADRQQIRQAILNVVENAREAVGSDGHIWIRTRREVLSADFVAGHPGSRAGAFAVLEVADDGPGMPVSEVNRVFEPFFTTKNRNGAHGLGLSQAYGIVKCADGYIHVGSALGMGTRVGVYLPLLDERGAPHDGHGTSSARRFVRPDPPA